MISVTLEDLREVIWRFETESELVEETVTYASGEELRVMRE